MADPRVPYKSDKQTVEWVPRSSTRAHSPLNADRLAANVSREAPVGKVDSSTSRPRRREPRYNVVEDRLWMQWWDGVEYHGRAARLVNVSRHGAMIVGTMVLKESQVVRIFLEEPAPQIGVSAVVKGVVLGRTGLHQLRVEFKTPCPEEFIEAASNGFEKWLSGNRRKGS